MVPVYGEKLKNGTYDVTVISSSPMFNITHAVLTVSDGKMTVVLTKTGSGQTWMFMGATDEISTASNSEFIPGVVDTENNTTTFTLPIEALDKGIVCAAYSKSQDKWYGRTILIQADSLPAAAWKT